MNGYEKFGTTAWLAERDEAFFRVVRNLFESDFLAGASAMLAGYDEEQEESRQAPGVAVLNATVQSAQPVASQVGPRECSAPPRDLGADTARR